jgi:hypothetical protein
MKRTSVFYAVSVLLVVLVAMIGCRGEAPEAPDTSDLSINDLGISFDLDEYGRPIIGPGETNDTEHLPTSSPLVGLTTTDLNTITATDVVNALIGAGPNAPTISNVTVTGVNHAVGTFAGGTGIIGFENGIILSSGNIASVPGPNFYDNVTTNNGLPGDPDLDGLIPGYQTYDATVLEFDFECPTLLVISFQYVFTSDEYNEYVNSPFNDVFGFFVNGTNIALLPDLVTPVAINTVNCNNPYAPPTGANCGLYINNDVSDGGGAINTEMDGLTVVFTATTAVNPGINHIKLAIADAGDEILDSNVFIKGESFLCVPPPPPATLDIHPTSCPNPVNVKSKGVTPAAILGTEGFDVSEIDVSTLLLEGVAPIRHDYQDVATPFEGELCDCTEEGPDGVMDLTLKFKTQELVAAIPQELGWQTLTITGLLHDGTPFEFSDCIILRGLVMDKKIRID